MIDEDQEREKVEDDMKSGEEEEEERMEEEYREENGGNQKGQAEEPTDSQALSISSPMKWIGELAYFRLDAQ